MRDKLEAMDADTMATANINIHSLSDAPSVQLILEQYLEKKSGDPVSLDHRIMLRYQKSR